MKERLLRPHERKEIIEEVARKYHDEGIKRLAVIGHFDKFTPYYHFRIGEPLPETSNIYVTELFGPVDFKQPTMFNGGVRLQYRGSVDGLELVMGQGINEKLHIVGDMRPAYQLIADKKHLTQQQRLSFDNALRYLERVTQHLTPEIFRNDIYMSEVLESLKFM
ncbi:MAG: hypothetical protein KC535_00335 [Nanoarchaeota archaeon]|nr:hypothetical protein [Nanoarchaeota archaeon]